MFPECQSQLAQDQGQRLPLGLEIPRLETLDLLKTLPLPEMVHLINVHQDQILRFQGMDLLINLVQNLEVGLLPIFPMYTVRRPQRREFLMNI
jgi:hypothetical protein